MRKLLSLAVALAVAAADPATIHAADLSFPGTAAAPETVLPPLPEVAAGTIDLEVLRDRAFDLAILFPAEQYDLDTAVASFAGDPARAFALVRDLSLDPYSGALRSPAAVLGAGAGNSADKAQLLVELLRRMGFEARFAFGTLDEDHRHQLRTLALIPRERSVAFHQVATLAGLSAAAQERLAARARRDFAWLWAAVGSRLAPPAVAEILPSSRHVWVQALIDGAWVDMDPAPGLEPGQTMATLGTTVDALPEQMLQTVRLTVVAESLVDGGLTQTTALDRTLSAAAAADTQIFLTFRAAASGVGTVSGAVGALDRVYMPALTIGGESVPGGSLAPLSAVSADAGEGGGGMFGEDAQDFFGDEAATPPELAGLYLDVTVQVPWAESVTRRRVLIDRVDPAARAAGPVDRSTLVPVAEAKGMPEPFRTVHQILVSNGGANPHYVAGDVGQAAELVSEWMVGPEALAEMTLAEILWPVGALNTPVVLAAEELSIQALHDRPDVRFFAGAPRVFVMSLQPTAIADEQRMEIRFAVDLLHDTVAAVGASEVPGSLVAERMLWYGVLQSALETTLSEVRSQGPDGVGGEVTSTSTAMAADLAVLSAADAIGPAAPPALLSALAAGELVVANAGTPAEALASWWTIHPADGSARAIWAPGLGGTNGSNNGHWNNYTNARPSGRPWAVNPNTANGNVQLRQPGSAGAHAGECGAPNEDVTIMTCVEVPAGMTAGEAYAVVLAEVFMIVSGIVKALL